MKSLGNKIKDLKDILSSIDRIAYQIYESNFEEEIIYVVGIGKKGKTLSALIGKSLSSISDLEVQFITLEVDKKNLQDFLLFFQPLLHSLCLCKSFLFFD